MLYRLSYTLVLPIIHGQEPPFVESPPEELDTVPDTAISVKGSQGKKG